MAKQRLTINKNSNLGHPVFVKAQVRADVKKVVVLGCSTTNAGGWRSRVRSQLLVKKIPLFWLPFDLEAAKMRLSVKKKSMCFVLSRSSKIGCQADFVYKHLIVLEGLMKTFSILEKSFSI